jgi:nitrogen fixation protein NifQ
VIVLTREEAVMPSTALLSRPPETRCLADEETDDPVYRLLMRGRPEGADEFDAHVLACILTLAFWEFVAEQRPVTVGTGLPADALAALVAQWFPGAAYLLPTLPEGSVARSADEACLFDLLGQCTTGRTALQATLAAMVARRAQSANHLWQDLGLRDRGELSRLMGRHFRPLAARNSGDMKWKKFLYRMICRDAGYALCTAPSCSECIDFEACFGDESGESRLARTRRNGELRVMGGADV